MSNSGWGYVIAGSTSSNNTGDMGANKGETDVFIIRTDADGKKLWVKTYGGAGAEDAGSVTATPDGGFVIEGTTASNNSGDVGPNHGGDDIWLLKVDANGKLMWQKTLGGSLSEWDGNIINTSDGGLILTGYTASAGTGDVTTSHGPGGADIWIVKLDAGGKLL